MRINNVLVLLLTVNICSAQSFLEAYENTRHLEPYDHVNGLYDSDFKNLLGKANEVTKISGVFYDFDDIRFGKVPTDGSFLLFDNWNNKAILVVSGENLAVNNINYHVDEEKFISQMFNDSTFVFDFKGIERIIVNGRPFISNYDMTEAKTKVYEIIAEGNTWSLLKNYYPSVSRGDPNPMLNRARNKIRLRSNYFIMKNRGILPFNRKRSGFKSFIAPKNAALIDLFVKEKKLSFKKDEDLKEIFAYLNKLEVENMN